MNLFEIDLENFLFTIYEIRVKIPQPPPSPSYKGAPIITYGRVNVDNFSTQSQKQRWNWLQK